ncbi:MAG: heavy metal-binding domain-containing protein [Janthinobacterium lividum]
MKTLTRSRTKILRTAYGRMQDEAKRLGASGIIGSHISQREIAEDLWEYSLQGTAVGSCPSRPDKQPFVCTLSGQDYYSLTTAGYRPVGVALGVCIYYQKYHQRVQQKITSSGAIPQGQNAERSDFTRGIYTARRYAMAELEAEASALGAIGVLGVSVTAQRTLNRQYGTTEGMMIDFTVMGTAIAHASSSPLSFDYCMPLTD